MSDAERTEASDSAPAEGEVEAPEQTPPEPAEVCEEVIEPVWLEKLKNIISAPINCPDGYYLDHKGECREAS